MHMNLFRILGDVSHTISKCILIWAIHSNKSAEGVSLLTQILYVAVFCCRYVDIFWTPPQSSIWNFVLKNFYIISSIYIIVVMTRVYARTREREKAWRLTSFATGGSVLVAPLVALYFLQYDDYTLFQVLWTFSIILESVCVLPQLLLLRQTTVPTVIDSYYLLTLGSYRAFYLLNWIYRMFTDHKPDPISVVFGTIQTAFYIDFAWVYYSRQRVKLRKGGVVDSDDLRKGYLVSRVLDVGRPSVEPDVEALAEDSADEDGDHPAPKADNKTPNRWGARGVSISADDTLQKHDRIKTSQPMGAVHEDEERDPFLDDDSDVEDAAAIDGPGKTVLNSDSEWQDSTPGRS